MGRDGQPGSLAQGYQLTPPASHAQACRGVAYIWGQRQTPGWAVRGSNCVAMSTTEDGGGVSESLEGLVGALDKLKQSLGYGDEFALVEQHVQELQQENEELRQFAEAAILVRHRGGGEIRIAMPPRCAGAERSIQTSALHDATLLCRRHSGSGT